MTNETSFRIAVLPGDGIGIEVIDAALEVLSAAREKSGGFRLNIETLPAGAGHYRDTGVALPGDTLKAAEESDAILLGAMGLPSVRYPDGTEIAPQLDLRFHFNLYAGVRPSMTFANGPGVLADPRSSDIDFVLIRESTEGLFASHGKGVVEDDREARDTLVITRATSERLFDFAFNLARQRKSQGHPGHVTLVDKANVFKSFAFFREIFDERAVSFPDIGSDHLYVDAAALDMVRRPWEFDVLVTENMFGDILSDLAAGLVGGMGFAPSADIGDNNAVFQPAHGTAPDIMGSGKANPVACILSAAMMLDWLGARHDAPGCLRAAQLIKDAVATTISETGMRTADVGGAHNTEDVVWAVVATISGA
ncbi:MAG: isocitrate/isopropylmalate dehydrogenase family protein [Dehalococcoidia bacterium]|nr:isocitrate/isopropylmalate dehydrogenase family protein [Dehalococcoidia bacterium]